MGVSRASHALELGELERERQHALLTLRRLPARRATIDEQFEIVAVRTEGHELSLPIARAGTATLLVSSPNSMRAATRRPRRNV